ncbi:MAG TPA: HAD-IC family P-type ATPase [bacterium]|nr:HAD-IC family P-type ATPase [bacterium]
MRLAYLNGAFETGIKSLLDKAILDFKKIDIRGAKKVAEIPYDFTRRRSSIICSEKGEEIIITKGAPEEVFKICHLVDKKKANALYQSLSREGFRVLAIATRKIAKHKPKYQISEEKGLTLHGFVAFYDPPKKSASETIRFMKEHGIEIKILTGDSPLVTEKICRDLNITITGIISGDELDIDKLSHQELALRARQNNIFARLSPMQKEKIIETLKNDGSVVGYMGDGINDAPSLKMADVGISVDNAVDVAKKTADIILMKKGLQELMDGVLEGRKTFGNTMKYLMMGLSSNFGNMFSLIGASLFLPFFPMLPGQILFNNLLYDTSQLAIPTDRVDEDYLKKPKHWDMKFIKRFMYVFGPISSVFDLITFYVLFAIFGLKDSLFQTGWFMESLATQVLVVYIIRTKKLPFIQSWPSKYLAGATLLIIAIGWLVAMTPLGNVFDFTPLPFKVIGSIIIIVLSYLLVTEIVKRFFYRRIYRHDGI